MQVNDVMRLVLVTSIVAPLVSLGGCVSSGTNGNGAGNGNGGGASGEIPIVAAAGADVPYQLGNNSYGVIGGAFLAKANFGSETVAIDTTQTGKICMTGTVATVPVPADGSHPPYSDYWGIELGFNLNQAADGTKNPWMVPSAVSGFWFTAEGTAIPPMRFKTTPTGRDPAQEQDSCALVAPTSGVMMPVPFADMFVQCWDGPQGTGTTDVSVGLLDMGLQVAASTDVEYPIDFCLTKVGVITN